MSTENKGNSPIAIALLVGVMIAGGLFLYDRYWAHGPAPAPGQSESKITDVDGAERHRPPEPLPERGEPIVGGVEVGGRHGVARLGEVTHEVRHHEPRGPGDEDSHFAAISA